MSAAPHPWYPSSYVPDEKGPRADLDRALDDLRLGGLVQLTEWVPGQGQGYALTPEGAQLANSPTMAAQLQAWTPSSTEQIDGTDRFHDEGMSPLLRGDTIRDALARPPTPWMTRILVFVNVVVFLAGAFLAVQQNADVNQFFSEGNGAILIETGAYTGEHFVSGQWWRLVTTCFVHAGLLHIGFNMLALYSFGRLAEGMFGTLGLLIIYLLSGVGGSIGAVIANPKIGCVGASGAICGIMGAAVAWVFVNRGHLPPAWVGNLYRAFRNAAIYIIIFSLLPHVSAAGHFGGAVVGLAAGALLAWLRSGHGVRRWLAGIALAALPFFAVAAVSIDQRLDGRWDEVYLRRWVLIDRKAVEALWEDFQREWKEAREQLPKPGDREAIAKTRANLAQAKVSLEKAAAILERAGPSPNADAERERQFAIQQTTVFLKRIESREKRLDATERTGSK
jgi:membrane associated rhomboid family serine protease